jgi:hypothetical protein
VDADGLGDRQRPDATLDTKTTRRAITITRAKAKKA